MTLAAAVPRRVFLTHFANIIAAYFMVLAVLVAIMRVGGASADTGAAVVAVAKPIVIIGFVRLNLPIGDDAYQATGAANL